MNRRCVWHGLFFFILGLVSGMFIQSMTNPRMGLTTHVGTVLNGTFLLAIGAAWDQVRLEPGAGRTAFWLLLFGSYGGCASLLLAAVLGTRNATPIAGAGYGASAAREALVTASLTVTALALLVGCAVFLRGLRAAAPEPGRA